MRAFNLTVLRGVHPGEMFEFSGIQPYPATIRAKVYLDSLLVGNFHLMLTDDAFHSNNSIALIKEFTITACLASIRFDGGELKTRAALCQIIEILTDKIQCFRRKQKISMG